MKLHRQGCGPSRDARRPASMKVMGAIFAAMIASASFFMGKPLAEQPFPSLSAARAQHKSPQCKPQPFRPLLQLAFRRHYQVSEIADISDRLDESNLRCGQRNHAIGILKIALENGGSDNHTIDQFNNMLKRQDFDPRSLARLHELAKRSGSFASAVVGRFCAQACGDRIQKLMLSEKYMGSIGHLEASLKKSPDSKELIALFSSIIRNGNFGREMTKGSFHRKVSDLVGHIGSSAGENKGIAIGYLIAYAQNERFKPGSVSKRTIRKIIDLADAVKRKDEELGSKMFGVPDVLGNEFFDVRLLGRMPRLISGSAQPPEGVFTSLNNFLVDARLKGMAEYVLKRSRYPGHVFSLLQTNTSIRQRKSRPYVNRMISLIDLIAEKSGAKKHEALAEAVNLVWKVGTDKRSLGQVMELARLSKGMSHRTFRAFMTLEESNYEAGDVDLLLLNLAVCAKRIIAACGDNDAAFKFWNELLNEKTTRDMALEGRDDLIRISRIISYASTHSGEAALRALKSIIFSGFPKDKLEMLALVIDKDDSLSSGTIGLLESLARNPAFHPSMLNRKLMGQMRSLARTIRARSKDGMIDPWGADKILEHKRFRPAMLGDLIAIVSNSSKPGCRGDNTLENLRSIMESRNFNKKIMGDLAYLANKTRKNSWVSFSCLRSILASGSFKPSRMNRESLDLIADGIYYLSRKYKDGSYWEGLAEAAASPYLSKEMLDVMKKLANSSADSHANTALGSLFGHHRYRPEMLGQIKQVLERYPEDAGIVFTQFGIFMSRHNFRAEHLKAQNVKWWADIIRDLEMFSKQEDRYGGKAVTVIERVLLNPRLNPSNIITHYKDAEKFAKSIGAHYKDSEVCLNFIYAISVLGKEKTKQLYWKLGIEYFGRYSKKTLIYVYDSIFNRGEPKDKPLLLVVNSKSDWNGAFYQDYKQIDQLRSGGYYRMLIAEAGDEDDFYAFVSYAGGKGKLDTLIVGGHGEPSSIKLGAGFGNGSEIDLTDRLKMEKLRRYFGKGPIIVLVSCSTGKGENSIGALFSKIFGATTFAPTQPDSLSEFVLESSGRLRSARFGKGNSVFVNGKSKDASATPREFYE